MTESPSDQSPSFPPVDERYTLLRKLGEGGFGAVYLARDTLLRDKLVALKILRHPDESATGFAERFLSEIEILRGLRHDGIPQIFDTGRTNTRALYFTMEFIDGESLATSLRTAGTPPRSFPIERIANLLRQLLDILDYAHSRGVIHRDLKPANIMLVAPSRPDESVRVLDFGIAKVLRNKAHNVYLPSLTLISGVGTPHYMAPEQVRGRGVDASTDIFALGVVLYQMCTGRLPFEGDSDLEIATARLEDEPRPFDPEGTTPEWMRQLILSMLRRLKEERPTTAAIRTVLARHISTSAPQPTTPLPARDRDPTLPLSPRGSGAPEAWISARKWLFWASLAAVAGLIAWNARPRTESGDSSGDGINVVATLPRSEEVDAHGPVPEFAALDGTIDAGPSSPTEPNLDDQPLADDADVSPPHELPAQTPDVSDRDGDGVSDDADACPDDALKTSPGACGCGVADTDTDGDGAFDCVDACPLDPNKLEPGVCGCGAPELDSDGDGAPDCVDQCPHDPRKTAPGVCGCHTLDLDRDGDGVFDCDEEVCALTVPDVEREITQPTSSPTGSENVQPAHAEPLQLIDANTLRITSWNGDVSTWRTDAPAGVELRLERLHRDADSQAVLVEVASVRADSGVVSTSTMVLVSNADGALPAGIDAPFLIDRAKLGLAVPNELRAHVAIDEVAEDSRWLAVDSVKARECAEWLGKKLPTKEQWRTAALFDVSRGHHVSARASDYVETIVLPRDHAALDSSQHGDRSPFGLRGCFSFAPEWCSDESEIESGREVVRARLLIGLDLRTARQYPAPERRTFLRTLERCLLDQGRFETTPMATQHRELAAVRCVIPLISK